jgi:hypothetical protein
MTTTVGIAHLARGNETGQSSVTRRKLGPWHGEFHNGYGCGRELRLLLTKERARSLAWYLTSAVSGVSSGQRQGGFRNARIVADDDDGAHGGRLPADQAEETARGRPVHTRLEGDRRLGAEFCLR